MKKYIRLNKSVNSKGELVELNSPEITNKLLKDKDMDWYTSLCYYGEDAKTYFDENKSIAGFNGAALSNRLVFDFDDKANPDNAKKDAITLINKLQTENSNAIRSIKIFFSGNKGFHVEYYIDQEINIDDMKNICQYLCSNLSTFDTVIYNTTRLYRMPNTRHQSSKLYKIELEPDDLLNLSLDQIKTKAKEMSSIKFSPQQAKIDNLLTQAKKVKTISKPKNINKTAKSISGIRGIDSIEFDNCPKNRPLTIFALEHGIMQSGAGERSEIFRGLAVYYRNQGIPKKVAHRMLKGVSELNHDLYPEHDKFEKDEIWNTVITSAYNGKFKRVAGATGISEDNEIFKRYYEAIRKYTDKPCVIFTKNNRKKTTVQIDDVSDDFSRFASNFDKNTIKTGIALIDNYMNIAIGTTTLLVGACGSGKTTLALNIMENSNKLDQHTMFFSLDMHKNLVYLKLATKVTQYTQAQVLEFFKTKNQAKILEIKKAIKTKYGKTFFDFSSTLTQDEMRDKILDTEEKHGVKIKLVVVDYASRISGPFSDIYANARHNALKSTEVASDTDAAWIYISQISRNTGNGASPLRTKRAAKDSGDWEESATNVITVWRPFMGVENEDDVMRVFLAKNRMGKEVERPLHWDGSKGSVWDMTAQEYEDYKAEREENEKEALKKHFSGSR